MTTNSFDEAKLRSLVEKHWHFRGSCAQIDFDFYQTDLGVWLCSAAPALKQFDDEFYWSTFSFNLSRFLVESEVEYEVLTIESRHEMSTPCVKISGRFEDHPFILSIKTEPDPKESVPF